MAIFVTGSTGYLGSYLLAGCCVSIAIQ